MGFFSWLGKMFGPKRQRWDEALADEVRESLERKAGGTAQPASQAQRQQKPARKLNLDPGQFAPLTSDQVRRRARWQMGSLFRNPWFGRRDLIPPVSDDRTALIDRGMVGVGLLTPEQLVEIHEVGAQMDKLRPDLAQATAMADQAARLDEEERKRRKEQKKADAAERKRRHAEEVAKRKLTDIVF